MESSKITISSDHVDSHGDVMTKQALESGARIINGTRKVKYSVEHKRDLPPLGKILNASIEERDGHNYLIAEYLEYDIYEEVDWDKNLMKASCSKDSSPFNEPDFDMPSQLEVKIDRHNFNSNEEYKKYCEFLKNIESEIVTEEFARKSILNDPELIITVAEYYFIYKLLKPTADKAAEKISERISEKIAEDSSKFYDFIRNSVKKYISMVIPKNRPVNYIISFPGEPNIELFSKITDPELLIKALKEEKMIALRKEINELENRVNCEKIQYTLTTNGKWKFNYLLTDKGETIGRKISFKKRDKKVEMVKRVSKKKSTIHF